MKTCVLDVQHTRPPEIVNRPHFSCRVLTELPLHLPKRNYTEREREREKKRGGREMWLTKQKKKKKRERAFSEYRKEKPKKCNSELCKTAAVTAARPAVVSLNYRSL